MHTTNGVSLSPASGAKQDFSKPVTYTVTAQDGTTASYTVIVSYDHYVYIGSGDGNLYALDAASGDLVWKFTTAGPNYSGPCIVDDSGVAHHPTASGDQQ